MEDKKKSIPEEFELQKGDDVQHIEENLKTSVADKINQGEDNELYLEAIQRYPVDEAIDQEAEKRLKRKLDMRILPLLGICYFFYVRRSSRAPYSEDTANITDPNSMLIRPHFPTQPSLASKKIFIYPAHSIHGCRVSSILDGYSGQFHPTSSCSEAERPGISPSTSSCGACFSCARLHRRISKRLRHFGFFLGPLRQLLTLRSCSLSLHTIPVPSNLGVFRPTTYGTVSVSLAAA